jgi:uncharacterized membrane protein YqhA
MQSKRSPNTRHYKSFNPIKKINDLKKIKSNFLRFSGKLFVLTQDINSPKIQKFAKLFHYEQTRFKKGIFHFIDTMMMISSSAIMTFGLYNNISREQSEEIKTQLEKVGKRDLDNIKKYISDLEDISDIKKLEPYFDKEIEKMHSSNRSNKKLQTKAYSI